MRRDSWRAPILYGEAALGSGYASSEEWDPAHAVRAWLFQPAGPGLDHQR